VTKLDWLEYEQWANRIRGDLPPLLLDQSQPRNIYKLGRDWIITSEKRSQPLGSHSYSTLFYHAIGSGPYEVARVLQNNVAGIGDSWGRETASILNSLWVHGVNGGRLLLQDPETFYDIATPTRPYQKISLGIKQKQALRLWWQENSPEQRVDDYAPRIPGSILWSNSILTAEGSTQ
jgi:hypothetical protein